MKNGLTKETGENWTRPCYKFRWLFSNYCRTGSWLIIALEMATSICHFHADQTYYLQVVPY